MNPMAYGVLRSRRYSRWQLVQAHSLHPMSLPPSWPYLRERSSAIGLYILMDAGGYLPCTSSTGGEELFGLPSGHVMAAESVAASTVKGASPANVKSGALRLRMGEAHAQAKDRVTRRPRRDIVEKCCYGT